MYSIGSRLLETKALGALDRVQTMRVVQAWSVGVFIIKVLMNLSTCIISWDTHKFEEVGCTFKPSSSD